MEFPDEITPAQLPALAANRQLTNARLRAKSVSIGTKRVFCFSEHALSACDFEILARSSH